MWDDEIDISDDEPAFPPGEKFAIEEFVAVTLDGWGLARDALIHEGLTEAAEGVEDAIQLLKATYPAGDLMDMSLYEKQMNGEGE